jgi:ankyrin repeat protein
MDCAQGATPLVLACMLGRLEHVNILLDCPSVLVDTRDASGLTPLMRKPFFSKLRILRFILTVLRLQTRYTVNI